MTVGLVSIIIISRGKDEISGLLSDIERQKTDFKTEVIRVTDVFPPGKARNTGAAKAAGEVLTFLDSDIRLGNEQCLTHLIETLETESKAGAVCPALRLPPQTSSFQIRYAQEIAHSETSITDQAVDIHVAHGACFVIKKELFIKLGGFNEQMIRGEDSELTERMKADGCRVILAPQTWCFHPSPGNIKQLIQANIRNGSGVAFVDVFYPRLNFDISPAGVTYYSAPKTKKERAIRFFRTSIKAIGRGYVLLILAKLFYALGYVCGLIKYTAIKRKKNNNVNISPVLCYTMKFKEKIFNLVKENNPGCILDIGCGKGDDLERIALSGRPDKLYGLDNSIFALTEAKKRLANYKNCYLIQGQAEALPFNDSFFDIIIASEVIEHIAQPLVCLSEIHRVLKSNGTLILTTPSKYNYVKLIGKIIPRALKRSLRRLVYSITPGEDKDPHFREYTPQEMKLMLRSQGFLVERLAPGVMRVPAWQLFDRSPILLTLWKGLDRLLGILPFGRHLKANYVIAAKKLNKDKSKILIINLGGMGDVLLSQPALKALRQEFSASEISLLVTKKTYELAKNLSFIERVYKLDIEYGGLVPINKIITNLRTLLTLRCQNFDLAVNMRTLSSKKSTGKLKMLLAIINPKVKAGRNTDGRGDFYDIKISESYIGQKYERDYDLETAEALGAKITDKDINVPIKEADQRAIEAILKQVGINAGDILIGIHPGGMPSRRWPEKYFIELINCLSKKVTAKFIITGSAREKSLARAIVSNSSGSVIDFTGALNFEQLCAIIKRCNLYISNDTGPMHIAAIVQTKLIAIIGPGDITRFDPRNISPNASILYRQTPCAPCEKVFCRDMRCVNAISVTDVLREAYKQLEIRESR